MGKDTRPTVSLNPHVYRALKLTSASTDRSDSDLLNTVVLEALREDALDLEALDKRRKEPARPFE